jgi:DedD protein
MELRARERLVGALVLVAAVVVLVPAILKGRAPEREEDSAEATRRFVVELAPGETPPREEELTPEPELPREPAQPVASSPPPDVAASREDSTADAPGAATPAPVRPVRNEAPAAAAASPAWAIQLGAFSNRDSAEKLVSELRRHGYSAFVLEYRATGKVLYRVRVGPEQDRKRAEEIAARLGKDGFQPVVARHP